MTEGKLLAAYIFGSTARGDNDARSDLDVLAIVEDNRGKVAEADVLSYIPKKFDGSDVSISWYGLARISQMFENGELFAWHLYRETLPIFETSQVIRDLGEPGFYEDGKEDIDSFRLILSNIPNEVSSSPHNAVYELGLIYVCVRNIAMSASWTLRGYPDFSRYSPFNLPNDLASPLSRDEYDVAMRCRLAGQRGLFPPTVSADDVLQVYRRVHIWVDSVLTSMEISS